MKKLISFILIASILVISMGNVFAATVPGTVYTDHTQQDMDTILKSKGVKDVKSTDWYAQGVASLLEAGYITPDSNGNINPLGSVTAGEAVSLILKVLGLDDKNASMGVAFARAMSEGFFDSDVTQDQLMTRIEVATLVARAFSMSYVSIYNKNLFPFEDFAAFTPDERGMVRALNQRGLIIGYAIGGGKYEFRPLNLMTKAELYIVVSRLTAFSLNG